MAKREVAWAAFCSDRTRVSAGSSTVPAVATGGGVRLFVDTIDDLPFLVIEDAALPFPTCVPLTNVASLGWAKPVVEAPAPKAGAKPKAEAAA